MSNPALQNAAMVWKIASPRDPIPCPSRAKRTVSATTPTSSTSKVMSATWPTRRATFLGVSGLASSSRTMRSSLNPMRRPIRSAPTVAAVIIPSPPSCMSAARIPCPTGVKASAGTTAWRPVTVTALTDSKKASSQVMPLFAPGIFSKNVPTAISPANASNMSLGAESRGNTSAGIPARSSSADVDGGASHGIRLGLPQDLMGDGGGVALAEEEVAEQVHDGVSFGPAEVAVRRPAGGVAQVEQQGGDGVGDHRAYRSQHLVLAGVLPRVVARAAPVSDDVDLSLLRRLDYKALGRLVDLYPLLPELDRAVDPRDERRGDDRDDEEGGDHEPVWPLYLVRREGVDEHNRDHPERERLASRAPPIRGERHREGG